MRKVLCFVGLLVRVTPFACGQEKPVVLVEAVAPVYPLVAAYTATSGEVKVKLTVDRTGLVTTAFVLVLRPRIVYSSHTGGADGSTRS